MSEYIKLDDSVYFTANFYHPTSGFSYVADATPNYLVYESGASVVLEGAMTARSTIVGSYWANFVASAANGFTTGRYYDVQVSGIVQGVGGFSSAKEFVLGDIFDANVVQVSGVPVSPESTVDANIVSVSGQMVSPKSTYNANVVQVSGTPVSLEDFRSTLTATNVRTEMDANSLMFTAISGQALTAAAVRTEIDINSAILASISGSVIGLAGAAMRGTDNAALAVNLNAVSGIIATNTNLMAVSGVINTIAGDVANVDGYAIQTNLMAVSGVINTIAGDVANIDGYNIGVNLMAISGIIPTNDDIYFAHIKYISDSVASRDEFAVQWFKNDQPVGSGDLTSPRLSVYNTSTGAAIINGVNMNYASSNLGVVRYNHTATLPSGEPYLIETSGTIDTSVRTWKTIVGIDLL